MVFHFLEGEYYKLPETKHSPAHLLILLPSVLWELYLEWGEGNFDISEKRLKMEPLERE